VTSGKEDLLETMLMLEKKSKSNILKLSKAQMHM